MRRSKQQLPLSFNRLRRLALFPSLAMSAVLMAAGLSRPDMSWATWVSLLPLLAAARSLRPISALLAGGGWGLCFYAAAVGGLATEIHSGFASMALLAIVPAAYTFLGSLMTRALGFIPVMMALLWILAEAALAPLGLHGGLAAGAQIDGQFANWLAGLLGYVFVASFIVYANALILQLLGRVRLTPLSAGIGRSVTLVHRAILPPVPVTIRRARYTRSHPRAPPLS